MNTINSSEAFETNIETWRNSHATGEAFVRPTVYARRAVPDWLVERVQKIDRLGQLEANWDSYGARKVQPLSIQYAKSALCNLGVIVGVRSPTISATPDGFVSLGWGNGEATMDLDILPDGRMAFSYLNEADSSKDIESTTSDLGRVIALLTQW